MLTDQKTAISKKVIMFLSTLMLSILSCLGPAAAQANPTSTGTGFLINDGGWILTNKHVIQNCERIVVGEFGTANRTIIDPDNDVAAIKLSRKSELNPMPISDGRLRIGQDVVALGYPLTGLLSQSVKLTKGVVNSLSGIRDDDRFMQISAAIQNGNSGGPLLDKNGHVVGMVTAKLNEAALQDLGVFTENVNFALKSSNLKKFLDNNLIEYSLGGQNDQSLTTEEIAERRSPSTFLISCYGGNSESNDDRLPDNQQPTGPNTWYLAVYNNIDFWGGDKCAKGINVEGIGECAALCGSDLDCKAFTFNPKAKSCYIKDRTEFIIKTDGAISGLFIPGSKDGRALRKAPPLNSNFVTYPNQEYTGMWVFWAQPSDRINTIDQCLRFCAKDRNCTRVTFNEKERGTASCKVRRYAAGPLRIKRNASSFERIIQSVQPIGEIEPLEIIRKPQSESICSTN